MDKPVYPLWAGWPLPAHMLTQQSVSTPQTELHTNSDSTPPLWDIPALQKGDIAQMGTQPDAAGSDLELANAHPVKTPAQLTDPQASSAINAPTFAVPDASVPELSARDLSAPDLNHIAASGPDPTQPALLNSQGPRGLDILAASVDLQEREAPLPGLAVPSDLPIDMQFIRSLLAEWRHELLGPSSGMDVQMAARPGETNDDDFDLWHDSDGGLPEGDYDTMWMQQDGKATRRSRHMGLLAQGFAHNEGPEDEDEAENEEDA